MTAQTTTTVPAPKVQVGDLIDGRRVRLVTGQKRRTTSNAGDYESGRSLAPTITVSGHVVCIYFEDDGAPKYVFGNRTVEVARP